MHLPPEQTPLGTRPFTEEELLEMVKKTPENFQELYWQGPLISGETTWLGYPLIKSPLDLWNYQEIIWETKPTLIVETGTLAGGSALYLVSILDQIGEGRVITIDINPYPGLPENENITYFNGNSVAPQMVEKVRRIAAEEERVMVILDSDHSYEHVSAELANYADLVTPGCYLIVEDGWGPLGYGAEQAIREFMVDPHWNTKFEHDEEREKKFLMTFFTGGWLRRKA